MARRIGYEPLRSLLPERVRDGYGRDQPGTGGHCEIRAGLARTVADLREGAGTIGEPWSRICDQPLPERYDFRMRPPADGAG